MHICTLVANWRSTVGKQLKKGTRSGEILKVDVCSSCSGEKTEPMSNNSSKEIYKPYREYYKLTAFDAYTQRMLELRLLAILY